MIKSTLLHVSFCCYTLKAAMMPFSDENVTQRVASLLEQVSL